MKVSRRTFLSVAGAGAGIVAAPGLAGIVAASRGVEFGETRGDSLWTREAPLIEPAPRLEGERAADVAIIGGGYTGLACAYYLKKLRPDLSVILLESHRLGSGASSRNSGAVSETYRGIGQTPLSRRGFRRLMSFIEEEEIECDLRRGSVLELFPSERAERANHAAAPDAKWIAAEQLRESLHSSYYAGAVQTSDYATLHPAKLVNGHVKAARLAGAQLFEQSPVLNISKGAPSVLTTPEGAVTAEKVFIATNAYTPRLGLFRSIMLPVHQYTFATRKLTGEEIARHALDRWPLRFEHSILPVTNHLMPSGHFFIRIVLGYAGFNSCRWKNIESAKDLARRMFEHRYPWIRDIELAEGWHGVTGHTLKGRDIARPLLDGNILISVAYNGLGIMPGHNNGYLAACRFAGHEDEDARYFDERARHYPVPGELYRSLLFKPFMKLMTPV